MNYPLIKKWLGLKIMPRVTTNNIRALYCVDADELETKLAEGFEVYADDTLVFNNLVKGDPKFEKYVALAIGKQPIKKKTMEEAALDLITVLATQSNFGRYEIELKVYAEKAKKILEMK